MNHLAHLKNVKVFEDIFGRLYFDRCESDAEHMAAPADPTVKPHPKRSCRVYVESWYRQLLGARGDITVTVNFTPKGTDAEDAAAWSQSFDRLNEGV